MIKKLLKTLICLLIAKAFCSSVFLLSCLLIGKENLKYETAYLIGWSELPCFAEKGRMANSTNQKTEQFSKHQWQSRKKRESSTTKLIAQLLHTTTVLRKQNLLWFIHELKGHGQNLILREFQLCQTKRFLCGNYSLKSGDSNFLQKRERRISNRLKMY